MKKYSTLAVVFVAAVLIGLVAYSVIQLRMAKTDNDKKQVLTTFTVLADMAKNVAGDRADVDSLTKPGAEIHGYEPTPQDLVRLQKADIVLDNGMNL